jgi:2-polyprenyl-3-methyl-5-hydroxy-6-metoxy-1,4-benzoquinol methylase
VLYSNAGNPAVLSLVPSSASKILDLGCGAGDNAKLLRARGHEVWGVTLSDAEAERARTSMIQVWVGSAESLSLPVPPHFFDVLLMSHVLEHFAHPADVLCRFAPYVRAGGLLVAAVPNMAHWRVRLRILRGDWGRDDTGPFDRTHLQFWSVATAANILDGTPFRPVTIRGASHSVPLRPVRRLSQGLASRLDLVIGEAIPNLFAQQVVLLAEKNSD